MNLEITDQAGRLIHDAWRGGRVLVLTAPWQDYDCAAPLVGLWRRATDHGALDGFIRAGDGGAVYVASRLLPRLRARRLRLERHSVMGLWPGIAVRELKALPVSDGLR